MVWDSLRFSIIAIALVSLETLHACITSGICINMSLLADKNLMFRCVGIRRRGLGLGGQTEQNKCFV